MYDLTLKHILAVDDEPDNLAVLKASLEMMNGAIVETAGSCQEALACLDRFTADIIVTDLSMPKQDGYFLLHRLRARSDTHDLPIIALSAHAMSGDREHILAAGFDGYISKPFEILTLGADLANAVEKHLRTIEKPSVPAREGPLANITEPSAPVNGGNYAAG